MSAAPQEIPFHNAVTGQAYSAKNAQLLYEASVLMGVEDRAVAGFKQWLEAGRVVQKGQHGVKIYMIVDKKEENAQGEEAKHKVMKMRTVFFQSQTVPLGEPESQPEPVAAPVLSIVPIAPKAKPSKGPALRKLAENLQGKIDNAFGNRLENTPKRRREAASQRLEGYRLKRAQQALFALADLHDSGSVPEALEGVSTKAKVYELVATVLDSSRAGYYDAPVDTGKPYYSSQEAVALWALLEPNKEEAAQEALRRKIAAVRQSGIPGFFPTPAAVVDLMIDRAESNATFWENFLEPSAGDGAIASELVKRYPEANLSLVEVNPTLGEILKSKGFAVDNSDFLSIEPSMAFDAVIMNPPFENLADMAHVQHAFKFLRPGGVVVSVMSPAAFFRSNASAVAFREWFESVGGEVEDLPGGSFIASGTGVETKLVVIRK